MISEHGFVVALISGLTRLVARGRKRESSSCAASQVDCMAGTSASMAVPIADAIEQRPQKRQKRSSSTPAAPRPPQLPAQLQSRRRSRSRVGSLTTNVEHVLPTRVSTRLARKIHSFIDSRSADIYTHLAGPDGAGNLLTEPSTGSVILPTPNAMAGSQSVEKPRGRRRRVVNLTDENAKKDLMEEWARMRQSQGTLPLLGMDENACFSQMLLRDTRKGERSVSSVQLETITRRHTPDPELTNSQETILDDSRRCYFSTRTDSENALPAGTNGKELDHIGSVLPSGGGTEQPIVSSVDIEAPLTSIPDPYMDEGSPSDELVGVPGTTHNHDLLQYLGSSPPTHSVSPLRGDSVVIMLPINEQAEAVSLNNPSKDRHPVTFSQTYSFENNSIHLDSNEEFYMLDIPEIFTLPWEPVTPHLYVPPSLGKLISGMQVFLVSLD